VGVGCVGVLFLLVAGVKNASRPPSGFESRRDRTKTLPKFENDNDRLRTSIVAVYVDRLPRPSTSYLTSTVLLSSRLESGRLALLDKKTEAERRRGGTSTPAVTVSNNSKLLVRSSRISTSTDGIYVGIFNTTILLARP
jgi:hypothetical protein